MALVVAPNALLAAPDRLDRPACTLCGQGQTDLERNIFPTAKRAADGRKAHDDLLVRQAQRVRDLLPFFMHPLTAADHLDAAIGQDVGQPGLRLQIEVLLRMGAIFGLDNDVGRGEGGVDIARAHAERVQDVGIEVALAVHEGEWIGMKDVAHRAAWPRADR